MDEIAERVGYSKEKIAKEAAKYTRVSHVCRRWDALTMGCLDEICETVIDERTRFGPLSEFY